MSDVREREGKGAAGGSAASVTIDCAEAELLAGLGEVLDSST